MEWGSLVGVCAADKEFREIKKHPIAARKSKQINQEMDMVHKSFYQLLTLEEALIQMAKQ